MEILMSSFLVVHLEILAKNEVKLVHVYIAVTSCVIYHGCVDYFIHWYSIRDKNKV